ncbi:unnamed protein product [Cuscuta epithymum]|uniref:Uncharacterized protein n=1 Tax=Cuscuta epithymum TaxID=186058 RepID=A0AAV0DP57_9ASTE|nr:unnamed protein product [Cuscuta epithymum]CAH9140720.1 unnamed protein product [Cuscuta epithymum]
MVHIRDLKRKKKPKKYVNRNAPTICRQPMACDSDWWILSEGESRLSLNCAETKEVVDASTKVYVGGIPYYFNEDDIRSFFGGCGPVTQIDCMIFPDTGKFRGIAVINFKTDVAAKRALGLDGSDMIYIGNLSWEITEDDLRNLFSGCQIASIWFAEDKETGLLEGYAHVDFADNCSLEKALKLDQKIVCGRPVRISYTVPKKGRALTKSITTHANNTQVESFDNLTVVSPDYTAGPPQANNNINILTSNQAENVETGPISAKIRRRTCYQCGERGHVSSSCPKKQATEKGNQFALTKSKCTEINTQAKSVDDSNATLSHYCKASLRVVYNHVVFPPNNGVKNVEMGPYRAKRRSRICYVCRECGHESSSCPMKQTTEQGNKVGATKSIFSEINSQHAVTKSRSTEMGTQSKSFNTQAKSARVKRRRLCYVCHECGHESSSCPMKQAAEHGNQVGVTKSIFSEIISQDAVTKSRSTEMSTQSKSSDDSNFTRLNNVQVTNQRDALPSAPVQIGQLSAKIQRRTCDECGEHGHVLSSCPKKRVTEQGNQFGLTKSRSTEMNTQAKSVEMGPFRAKRRWICYVCHEHGHASSSCPMKQAAEQGIQVGVTKSIFSEINSQHAVTKSRSTEMSTQSKSFNTQAKSARAKRRRICYVCHECGHESSSCPMKQAAEQGNQVGVTKSIFSEINSQDAVTKSRSTQMSTQSKSFTDSNFSA